MDQKTKQIGVERAAAEQTLMAALPAIEAAKSELAQLDPLHVTELINWEAPPEDAQVCGECAWYKYIALSRLREQ